MTSPRQPEPSASAGSHSRGREGTDQVDLQEFFDQVIRQIEVGFARHFYKSGEVEGTVSDGRKLALTQLLQVLCEQGLTVAEVREALQQAGVQVEATQPLVSPGPWSEEKNARRIALIDKKIQGTLSSDELPEFESLQAQAIAYRDRVAPLPIEGAKRLHQELLEKEQSRKRPAE
jgi:hypothetical protein